VAVEGAEEAAPVLGRGIKALAAGVEEVGVEVEEAADGVIIDACGGVIFSPSSWEPQEEGMMNIAARFFPQLRNQGMSIRRGRSQYD
jgi:hypothetical protein